jgi:hypothetical protein
LFDPAVPAPVVPAVSGEADTQNFDEEFTKMELSTSLVEIEVGSFAKEQGVGGRGCGASMGGPCTGVLVCVG